MKKTTLGVTVRVDGLIEMFGLTRMRQTEVVIVVVKSCASRVDVHRGGRRLSQQKEARLISAPRKEDGGRGTRSSTGESSFVTDKRVRFVSRQLTLVLCTAQHFAWLQTLSTVYQSTHTPFPENERNKEDQKYSLFVVPY